MSTPNITAGDFQKLLQIALQSLSIHRTLLENRASELNEELRTLERDDELEEIDRQILIVKNDYNHYLEMVDPSNPFDLGGYYEYKN